jgi:hypothetical protein
MLIPRSNRDLFHKLSYFLRLKGSAGRTAAALIVCSKDRKILIQIKILKMRLRLPYEFPLPYTL